MSSLICGTHCHSAGGKQGKPRCVYCTPDHQLRGSTAPRPSPPRDQTAPSLENTDGHGCSSISPWAFPRMRLPPARPWSSSPAGPAPQPAGISLRMCPPHPRSPFSTPPPTKSLTKKNVFLALKSLENVCNSNTNF